MLTDGDWDEAHPYFCADCGHQLGTERGFRVSVEKIEISDSHSDLNPSADISIRLWTRLCKILKSRPFVPGMLKSAILAHCATPVGQNFRESQGASSVAPYQLPKISSLRGSLWVPETLLSRSGAKFLCIETDNEVNADLLAFIKEAIIAIRGRLQAWSTRGERQD